MLKSVLMFALCAATAHAQETVSGRVQTTDGTPIGGATVTLIELDRSTTSRGDGAFSFADVPRGTFTLVVRLVGYQSFVQQITSGSTGSISVQLTRSALRLPDITVTASRSPLAEFATPLPVSSTDAELLRRDQGISLAHTIDRLPGVHSMTTGGQIGKPVIRGMAGSRVLVLQDGLRLEDYSWSDEDGPSVDARLAQRIEVIRGPASLLYGSDAIGGVVNVIPAALPEAARGASFSRAAGELHFGSNARELGAVLHGEGARGGFGWRVTGIGRVAEALHTPAGELENTGFGSASGQASIGWHGEWGTASLRYDRYGGEFRLLEAHGPPPGMEESEKGGPERKLSDDRVSFAASIPLRRVRFEPRLQWQRHWLSELADAAEVGGSGFTETTIFDLVLNSLSADILAHTDIGARTRMTSGVSGFTQHNDSRAPAPGLPFVPDATINSIAGFAVAQHQRGPLSLLAGARADHRNLTAEATPALDLPAQHSSLDAISANAGAALAITHEFALTANVGSAWRAPNLFELYSNGPLFAEGRYVVGDGSLGAERSVNIDGGLRWTSEHARVEVSVYRNRIAHYIFQQPTAEFRDTLRVYRYKSAAALLAGCEAGAAVDVTNALSLRARYDVVRGTNADADTPLPLMPPPRANFEAELHSSAFRAFGRSFLSVGAEVERRQTRLNALDYPTGAHALIDLGAGIEPRLAGRAYRVDLRVHNAGNVAYRSFLSRYKEFALNPGRDIVLRVSTGF
jgi:iron complex outermembrane receptor protein